jgi:LysM repeat protein
MSGETLDPDVATVDNEKEISEFMKAYKAALTLRSDFGRKRGYVREKEPDEQAFHKVKPVFGEFRPFNRELMEKNTNNGKGVDVSLPDGKSVHINNQAELFDKIVTFNKERGDFYDERLIAKKNQKDYERLKTVNSDLDSTREALIKSFPKKGDAFKNISAIEKEVKAEFDAAKAERKAKRDSQPKKNESTAEPSPKKIDNEVNISVDTSPKPKESVAEVKLHTESLRVQPNIASSNIDLMEKPVAAIALDPNVPTDWVKEQDERVNAHMRHTLILSFLQEDRFSVERDHFYNEMHKRFGKEINTVQDADEYISRLMNSRQADSILRDTAPGTLAAVNAYLKGFDIDQTLKSAGYTPERITPEFREKIQISQAYATRIGGDAGRKTFLESLKEHKDSFMRGAGDARIGLAISGTLLGMGIMAGTGPAGLAIGGIKFANKLLETEVGKQFQKSLYESSVKFLSAVGVNPNILTSINSSIQDLWSKTTGSKWGKVAMFGAVAVGMISFGPSAMDLTPAHAATLIDPVTPAVPDIPPVDVSVDSTVSGDSPNNTTAKVSVPDTPAGIDSVVESNQETAPVVDVSYDIKAGDTLWDIAKEAYSQSHPGEVPSQTQIINLVNQIAEHNDLSDPNKIYAGKTIDIPGNLSPSSETVVGPTEWMTGQSGQGQSVNRLDGLNERSQEWRQENKVEPEPSLPRGIRV